MESEILVERLHESFNFLWKEMHKNYSSRLFSICHIWRGSTILAEVLYKVTKIMLFVKIFL